MNENTSVEKPNIQEHKKTNGWAIASFTLGVLGCINPLLQSTLYLALRALPPRLIVLLIPFLSTVMESCGCATPIISIVAIIVGVIAMLRIKKNKPQQKGVGLAIAGIVIGALSIIVLGGLFAYGIYVNYIK